ncbi:MAG: alpha/beta fold hydrolase [Deltaproteobacteria bacterium]|jgi:alpha-beta hydrolase superfamily lysophospholipase
MRAETFTLSARDGASIHVYRWLPEGEVRAIVQIAHGMAEHAARYARFAEALTAAGYAVYADDHRGHGKTAEERELGHFGDERGWERVLSDLLALGARAKSEHPGKKLVYFGHSMGSFFGQAILQRSAREYDAMILSGTNAPGSVLERAGTAVARLERLRGGLRGKSALLAFLSFGSFNDAFKPARTEFDWLSRDPAEVDRYVADPRCGFRCTNELWVQLLEGLHAIATGGFGTVPKDFPVHLLAGDRDPVSRGGKGVVELHDRLRSAGLTRTSLRLYPEARHEMLNETNREEVTRDLVEVLAGMTA